MKKVRPEIETKNSGGIFDMFDNMLKLAFNITDEEYDYIVENCSDEEIGKLVAAFGKMDTPSTFAERRAALEVRNTYLKQMKDDRSREISID
jgi:hypothetical protein